MLNQTNKEKFYRLFEEFKNRYEVSGNLTMKARVLLVSKLDWADCKSLMDKCLSEVKKDNSNVKNIMLLAATLQGLISKLETNSEKYHIKSYISKELGMSNGTVNLGFFSTTVSFDPGENRESYINKCIDLFESIIHPKSNFDNFRSWVGNLLN